MVNFVLLDKTPPPEFDDAQSRYLFEQFTRIEYLFQPIVGGLMQIFGDSPVFYSVGLTPIPINPFTAVTETPEQNVIQDLATGELEFSIPGLYNLSFALAGEVASGRAEYYGSITLNGGVTAIAGALGTGNQDSYGSMAAAGSATILEADIPARIGLSLASDGVGQPFAIETALLTVACLKVTG